MASMAFRCVDTFLVVVSNTQTPGAEEWTRYLDACTQLGEKLSGGLVQASAIIFTDGGGPDSSQRLSLKRVLRGQTVPAAMVTDALAIRAAVGLIGIFNPGIKVFPSANWKDAATFARIPESRQMEVLRVAVSLSHEVGEIRVLRSIGL